MTEEENPFDDPEIAQEWVRSVEGEKGLFRDNVIYPTLKSWVDSLRLKNILEIGYGQGICSECVSKEILYSGIDSSTILIARAKELYGEDREFSVGSAYHTPFSDGSFDAIFSVNVLFHLADLNRAFLELARLLKNGGSFLIITANPKTYGDWQTFYENPVIEGNKIIGKVNVPVNPLTKNIFYKHTQEEIEEGLIAAGLNLKKMEELPDGNSTASLFVAIYGSKL